MQKENLRLALLLVLFPVLFACKKTDNVSPAPPTPTGPTTPVMDSTAPLKDAADFPIGVAINYTPMTDAGYAALVKRDFDAVTFGWEMKHGAIVRNDGSKDYSLADQLMNLSTTAGVNVFGHTLVWYQNNNGDYLRSLTNTLTPTGSDMLASLNGNFDKAGSGSTLFDAWFGTTAGSGAATFTKETTAQ
ncbi:MAG TPA: endo-1,4-beta-xylanase, partial [Flavisolibacter sp.]|nr:endo-1,4-beta-xylanase [Flavisolibacter sp.]